MTSPHPQRTDPDDPRPLDTGLAHTARSPSPRAIRRAGGVGWSGRRRLLDHPVLTHE